MIEKLKKSLVAPLENEELHIFNSTYLLETCINQMIEVIDENVYGIYLIGGFRGVGKTSIINLCSEKYRRSNLIRITIDCNKFVKIENFMYLFIEELYQKVKQLMLDDDIVKELEDIILNVSNIVSNKITNKKNVYTERNNQQENTNKIEKKLGFNLFNNNFKVLNNKGTLISKTGINSVSNLKDMVQEIEEKREEFIVIDRIVKLINRISQTEESYNILLVIDEIDKQDEKIIDELIDYYKNLFFNTSIITFFVVDTLQYIKINSGNLLESKMLNYIIKSIYIPTLNRSELRDYLYREFNVNNYEQMVIINYLTQGIFRKVNVYKYLNAYKDRDIFNKAYIYDLLIKELETIDIPLYIRDLLYILIKDIIEELFIYGKIKFSDIEKSFNESKNKYLYKYNLNKILTPIKKVFKEISMLSYICLSTEDILFILKDNIKYEIRREYENKKIQYDIKDNLHSINSTINKSEPIFIKISNNQPEDYSYIIRLIETFSTEIVNLYFIKKITNFNEYEAEAYSIGIEVKKEIGQVMYVIEDFSFSYEDYYAVKGLVKYFEKLQINIPCIEMDDEPIEENIDYIRNKLEKRIYGECQ